MRSHSKTRSWLACLPVHCLLQAQSWTPVGVGSGNLEIQRSDVNRNLWLLHYWNATVYTGLILQNLGAEDRLQNHCSAGNSIVPGNLEARWGAHGEGLEWLRGSHRLPQETFTHICGMKCQVPGLRVFSLPAMPIPMSVSKEVSTSC